MRAQPTFDVLHRRSRRSGCCLGLLITLPASGLTGAVTLTHRLAARLGDASVLSPWVVPTLPAPAYLATAGLALALSCYLLARRRYVAGFLALAVTGFFALLLRGPVYLPHRGFLWLAPMLGHPATRSAAIEALFLAAASGILVFAVGVVAASRSRPGQARARVAHGSSRPAKTQDLHKAKLLDGSSGVYLGGWRQGRRTVPLTDASEDHVLLIMPSGAGKTSGTIVPTLLGKEPPPAVVLDPKGEIFELTAGWRARQGHRCIYFAPSSPSSLRWNCLAEITGETEAGDIRMLAENLLSYPASENRDGHWIAGARNLFRLLTLHCLYAHPRPSLPAVRTLLNQSSDPYELFEKLATYPHDPDQGFTDPMTGKPSATHPEVALLANAFAGTPDRELGSIRSTLQQFLGLWGDPYVARASSASDFTLEDILDPTLPTTLYIALPYGDLEPLAPLLRVLLSLLTRRLTTDAVAPGPAGGKRLLFVLDEFAALGRLPVIEQMLAFFRGYGVRAVLVVQDLRQLRRAYSEHETISGACQIHLLSASQSRATRRHLSSLAGETTVRYPRRSVSGGRMAVFKSRTSLTTVEARRPLITEGEAGTLPPDRLVILKTGLPPIFAWRYPYFENQELSERAALPPPEPKDPPPQIPVVPTTATSGEPTPSRPSTRRTRNRSRGRG